MFQYFSDLMKRIEMTTQREILKRNHDASQHLDAMRFLPRATACVVVAAGGGLIICVSPYFWKRVRGWGAERSARGTRFLDFSRAWSISYHAYLGLSRGVLRKKFLHVIRIPGRIPATPRTVSRHPRDRTIHLQLLQLAP